MKSLQFFTVKMFIAFTILLLSSFKIINGQALLKYPGVPSNFYDDNGKLGIGTTLPSARIHVRSNGFSSPPLFKTEIFNSFGTQLFGTIQHFVTVDNKNYGIYQTSATITGLLNYFQDPVKTGYVTIKTGLNNAAVIGLDPNVSNLDFNFDPGNPPIDPVTSLSINISGIRVKSNLVTDNFQMITGAGDNKILTGDQYGNAYWTNPPNGGVVPWLVTKNSDIVSNRELHYVGIGTENPSQMLEICPSNDQGGISIDQVSEDSTGSEIIFKKQSEPQFALGHNFNKNRSCFFIWSHLDSGGIGKTDLFIDLKNGMTGIGTEWPNAKLEVNGSLMATYVGIGRVPPEPPNGYRLFVEGGIAAREVKVTIGPFPDYCFSEDYKLMPLQELRTYIEQNKHLPDMPTAKEIEDSNGIELGAMQTILVKKVEEQTLYILDLQKQVDELKALMEKQTHK